MQQGIESTPKSRGRRPRYQTTAHQLAAGLERDLRSLIAQWVLRLEQRPQPKATLINVESGKSASMNILCVALSALATSTHSHESISQFCRALEVKLRAMAPLAPLCAHRTLEHEIMVQGPADVSQFRARRALDTGNRSDIEQAIDDCLAHRNALDDVIASLIQRLGHTPTSPMPRRPVFAS